MPFPMKIQPIDCNTPEGSFRNDQVKPVVKSRLKRLFERPFSSVMRISSSEKPQQQQLLPGVGVEHNKDTDLEPSSVCLAKMVLNFLEESNEKQTKCGRHRCNCFNGNCNDSSDDDELDFFGGGFTDSVGPAPTGDASDFLKNLVSCANNTERNILADISKIMEISKIGKPKEDCRKVVTEGLVGLGYDASVCKSRWDKASSYPAGEYEYIDVIIEGGDRLIIDIDFRSEFEIARSTKKYRAILQAIPMIFVGKADRLQQIVSVVSEAAKQSLKKKGMHFPPWRKAEYMRAKWLSPFARTTISSSPALSPTPTPTTTTEPVSISVQGIQVKAIDSEFEKTETKKSSTSSVKSNCSIGTESNFSGEFDLIFGGNSPSGSESVEFVSNSGVVVEEEGDKIRVVVSPWQPPAIKPKSLQRGAKIVTGLASILKDKP